MVQKNHISIPKKIKKKQIKVKSKLKFGKPHSFDQQLFLEIRVSKLPTKQQNLKFGLLVKFHSPDIPIDKSSKIFEATNCHQSTQF